MTCSPTSCPAQQENQPSAEPQGCAPRAVPPGGAGLPGRAAASCSSTADGWRLPQKGRDSPEIKGVLNQGHCCQAGSRHWGLFPEQCGKVRKGHLSLSWTLRSSTAATVLQFPAEENDSTSKAIASLPQRKKYQLQTKQIKSFPETPSSQNQPTASFAGIITHGQGFVSLIVLRSNSQATAVSFLKSHQSL